MSLDNIRIVMVNTSHPGNIGAAARVMKNMGLQHLYLVQPKKFPHSEAQAMASGADNILENAQVVDSLQQALVGCHLVMGTTARLRKISQQIMEPREAVEKVAKVSDLQQIAMVFGRERTGLTNEESALCQILINIPTVAEHASLNVASAIQVLAYELFIAHRNRENVAEENVKASKELPASHEELENYFAHLEATMLATGFLNPKQSPQLMPKLRRLYLRCELEKNEINILRGILSSCKKHYAQQ